jgi:hypothetical protein
VKELPAVSMNLDGIGGRQKVQLRLSLMMDVIVA